jgi:hypothetical protein
MLKLAELHGSKVLPNMDSSPFSPSAVSELGGISHVVFPAGLIRTTPAKIFRVVNFGACKTMITPRAMESLPGFSRSGHQGGTEQCVSAEIVALARFSWN